MKHVLYSEEYIYYLQLKRYKCLSKLGRVLMLWSKGILPPTDIHELLRCYATFAILKTFGFADFPWKSLHPHVFAGPKLKNLIVQARTAFGAFDPGIIKMHTMENRGVSSPAFHQPSPEKLLVVFAALISYCTGSLTCGLARSLALATATLCHGVLQSLAC